MQNTLCNDLWVELPQGKIFTRSWSPNSSDNACCSPIVLFHDSLGCIELWRDFPALLSAGSGRVVIAYDRLGFGRSDARTDRLGLDFIADEAKIYFAGIRRQLGINHFIAFGHSVGGGMAVNCAAAFPDACDALVTESAQAFVEDRTLQGISEAQELFRKNEQSDRLRKYHGDKTDWVLHAWIETWMRPEFATWSLEAVLPLVIAPLLVIHGEHDEYGSNQHPLMIGQRAAGTTRIEILPDTHHVPHRENAQAIVKLVTEFIASIR